MYHFILSIKTKYYYKQNCTINFLESLTKMEPGIYNKTICQFHKIYCFKAINRVKLTYCFIINTIIDYHM